MQSTPDLATPKLLNALIKWACTGQATRIGWDLRETSRTGLQVGVFAQATATLVGLLDFATELGAGVPALALSLGVIVAFLTRTHLTWLPTGLALAVNGWRWHIEGDQPMAITMWTVLGIFFVRMAFVAAYRCGRRTPNPPSVAPIDITPIDVADSTTAINRDRYTVVTIISQDRGASPSPRQTKSKES